MGGARPVVEAAAMRRVGPQDGVAAEQSRQAAIDAAFGAVRMYDIGFDHAHQRPEARNRREVRDMRVAVHGVTCQAERQQRLERGENALAPRSASRRIAEDADLVAAFDLGAGQVLDMPKEPADRGSEDMQDAQFALGLARLIGLSMSSPASAGIKRSARG